MTSATEKFLSFINNKIDSFNKALTLDQMFLLQSAQRQIAEADRPDYIQAKRQSTVFGASIEGWQYNKIGADLAEFVSDAVEFMLAIGLCYCVRTAEHRVKTIWNINSPLS